MLKFLHKNKTNYKVKLGLFCPGLALLQAVTGLAVTGTQGHVFAFLTIVTLVTPVEMSHLTHRPSECIQIIISVFGLAMCLVNRSEMI